MITPRVRPKNLKHNIINNLKILWLFNHSSIISGYLEKELATSYGSNLHGCCVHTSGMLCTFILAMTLHPDVQRRAHAELDSIIGHDQPSSFENRRDIYWCSCERNIEMVAIRSNRCISDSPIHNRVRPTSITSGIARWCTQICGSTVVYIVTKILVNGI